MYIPNISLAQTLILLFRAVYVGVFVCLGLSINIGAAAAEQGALVFDIPAQSLASALDIYSATTGREVFYDGALVLGSRSATVTGVLSPDIALRTLLKGTGFAPRKTGPHSFTIALMPQSALAAPTAVGKGYEAYFAAVQSSLRRAFCVDGSTWPWHYQLVIRFWISPSGGILRSQLLNSTGNRARAHAFADALRTIQVGEPPPIGMPQPVTMVVLPRSLGDAECARQTGIDEIAR